MCFSNFGWRSQRAVDLKLGKRAMDNLRDFRHMGAGYGLRHIHGRSHRPFKVHVKGVGSVTLRPQSSDPEVFSQIFARHDYDLRYFPQFERIAAYSRAIVERGRRPLILDLGANNGASALWFALLFPEAKVVAVEPEPNNAAICRENTQGHDVEVLAVAIGSTSGSVDLETAGEEWACVTSRNERGSVLVRTVDDIVAAQSDDYELFIVKIDIEGFEGDLFADNTGWVDQAKVVIIEPHDWMFPGQLTSRNFQRVLGAGAFEVVISGENLIYVR